MPTTTAQLTADFDYDAGVDGYITIGPIRDMSLDTFLTKMESNEVFAFTESCDVTVDRDASGALYITAVSEIVTGFFFDEDGNEAATSDIEFMLLSMLEDGDTLKVDGCYPDGQDGSVVTRSRFLRRGGEILRDIDRVGHAAGGRTTPVMSLTEVRDHEMQVMADSSNGTVVSLTAFRRKQAA